MYKTNAILQFEDRFTKKVYEKQLIPSAIYSIRIMLIMMWLSDFFLIGYETCATEGCFFKRLFSIGVVAISIFGTLRTPQTQKLNHYQRVIIMMAMPIYGSARFLNLYDGKNAMLVSGLFYQPTLLLSLFIISDWLEYLALASS